MHQTSLKHHSLATFTVVLAFCVILLGAYTRLKDAGLGCPDWPGCYGAWFLPSESEPLAAAQARYPDIPIEANKAWIEMAHRYLAGTLGLCMLFLAYGLLRHRRESTINPGLPVALIVLLFSQAALGMWTVTLKLLPVVVMGHLMGGFLCFSLLWWIRLRLKPHHTPLPTSASRRPPTLGLLRLALGLLVLQILLGGWTSANYAALVCPQFPFCNQVLWPHFDWQAFNLFGASQLDKPIDFMRYEARTTIHMLHRLGAVINVLMIGYLSLKLRLLFPLLSRWLLALLTLQIGLGITNVLQMLPLPVAVMHNGVAALLLITLITVYHSTQEIQRAQS